MLKSVPVGCRDILLPPNLVKRSDVNCLAYKSNKERCNDNICLPRAVCMHKTGNERVEEETKKLFNAYLTANPHLSVQDFRGVGLEDLHIAERPAEVNFLVYDIEVSDSGVIGELADRSLRPFNSTATLLRYNNLISYATDVIKVFEFFDAWHAILFSQGAPIYNVICCSVKSWLKTIIQNPFFNFGKLSLTNWGHSISRCQTVIRFSTILQSLTSNQFVSKTVNSLTPRQQPGLVNTNPFQCP